MTMTEQIMKLNGEKVNEFKKYVKNTIKERGCHYILWNLPNGDQIYFQHNFRKPHVISPEPFKEGRLGDFGYEGAVDWAVAWEVLNNKNLIGSDDEECYGW